MYWALVGFNFFVALSAIAIVLGDSPENPSPPYVIAASTVIAVVALIMLTVNVVIAVRNRKTREGGNRE